MILAWGIPTFPQNSKLMHTIYLEQKKKHLTDECYLKAAHEALGTESMIGLMNAVPREICEWLPDSVVTDATKEEIWLPTTIPIRAASLIKQVNLK